MSTAMQAILTQILGISQRDHQTAQALVYAPAPLLQDELPPEMHWQRINADVVRRQIQNIRSQVEELIWRARLGKEREDAGIEAHADALASHVLPKQGFAAVVPPGLHPRLDIAYDIAGEIPWEILEEIHVHCDCPAGTIRVVPRKRPEGQLYCEACGKPMVKRGGKLGIDRHITHLVRGGKLPTAAGNEFLVIEDPTEDLCSAEVDPQGQCKRHLTELKRMLEQAGYQLNLIRRKNATTRHVLAALENPAVVGLYYFGHGLFNRREDQGCLLLADGPLYAGELEDLSPGLRFAFLNACEGGAVSGDWTLEKKFRSVGHALARGGPARTVIAPLWPVVNIQAADMALELFGEALAGRCLGEAVRQTRVHSLERYEAGDADISWMAYRYFGDPNRGLPSPQSERPVTVAGAAAGRPAFRSRLFAQSDKLDPELFAFGMRDVLFRAAKRRNLHDRVRVTPTDIFAGLIRTGQLTRFILEQLGNDPDKLYGQIIKEKEAAAESDGAAAVDSRSPSDATDADDLPGSKISKLRKLLGKWVVRHKDEFSPTAISVLEAADQTCQATSDEQEDHRISEQDLLLAFMEGPDWVFDLKTDLPTAASIRQQLARPDLRASIDENGCLLLTPLTPTARRIVETAHELAQQRGICPIPNRLLLAAFLNQPDGFAVEACRHHRVNAEKLALLLIAATEGKSPETFALSPSSSARVLLPTLQHSDKLRRELGCKRIDDAILFKAYCQIAPGKFKKLLTQFPSGLRADLDSICATELPKSASEADHDASTTPAVPDSPSPRARRAIPPDVTQRPISSSIQGEPTLGETLPSRPESRPAKADNAAARSGKTSTAGDRFDRSAERVLASAGQFAMSQGYREIRSVHLFVALGWFGTGLLRDALARRGVLIEDVCLGMLRGILPRRLDAPLRRSELCLGSTVAQIVTRSEQIARDENRRTATERDLAQAILADRHGAVAKTLAALQCDWLLDESLETDHWAVPLTGQPAVLSVLGIDLTEMARAGTLPKAIGRHDEIGLLVRTLDASRKDNVLLVGDPGVGKTTVARGLADWIAEGLTPESLRDVRVVELSASVLLGMAPHVSEYARRFESLMSESRPNVILLIRHLDLLAAGASPSLWHRNANRLLKAALAESPARVIGTTSTTSHKTRIVPDYNLANHLEVQRIAPPASGETSEIVEAHREKFQREYCVSIDADVPIEAIRLTQDAPDRCRPGPAVALLEHACHVIASRGPEDTGIVDVALLRDLASQRDDRDTGTLEG